MSKYVTKKHGIIIGSGNVFFYKDENDEFHDFPCVLWASQLVFENTNSFNVRVRSPAEQLLWDIKTYEEEDTLGVRSFTKTVRYCEPSWSTRQWLDKNAPGWGMQTREGRANGAPSIFFKKRSHALAFYQWLDSHLKGMHYL